MKRKLLILTGASILAAATLGISLPKTVVSESKASDPLEDLKDSIVFNWDGEEFLKDSGVNVWRYNGSGVKTKATRLSAKGGYDVYGAYTSNIYDEPNGVAQGMSYAKHSTLNEEGTQVRMCGPVYYSEDGSFAALDIDDSQVAAQGLSFSYWVKNTNQESNRWADDVAASTLNGAYEGIFTFRNVDAQGHVLSAIDLGIGGIYYYIENSESETDIAKISQHSFINTSTPKRSRTYGASGNQASFMSVDWEMVTVTMDPSNGLSFYKDGTLKATYAPATTLLNNKGSAVSMDSLREIMVGLLRNPNIEFCVHRGFKRNNSYGGTYRIGIGIDDLNIFNKALSSEEVALLHSSYKTITFNDGSNALSKITDIEGNQLRYVWKSGDAEKTYGPNLTKGDALIWKRFASDSGLLNPVALRNEVFSSDKTLYIDWLNKDTGVTDSGRLTAMAFADENLHMDDYNADLGYCSDSEHHYYQTAKAAYQELSEEGKYALSHDPLLDGAWARFVAWATANNDIILGNSGSFSIVTAESAFASSVSTVLLFGSAILGSLAIGCLFIRKRKSHK